MPASWPRRWSCSDDAAARRARRRRRRRSPLPRCRSGRASRGCRRSRRARCRFPSRRARWRRSRRPVDLGQRRRSALAAVELVALAPRCSPLQLGGRGALRRRGVERDAASSSASRKGFCSSICSTSCCSSSVDSCSRRIDCCSCGVSARCCDRRTCKRRLHHRHRRAYMRKCLAEVDLAHVGVRRRSAAACPRPAPGRR